MLAVFVAPFIGTMHAMQIRKVTVEQYMKVYGEVRIHYQAVSD